MACMAAPRVRPYWLLGLLTGVNLVNYLDRYLIPPVLPAIRRSLGASGFQAGLLVSAFFLVYMLASPPLGWLADRHSRRRIIAAGVMLWSLATLLSGWAPSYGWLLAARALVGIGEAAYACIVPAIIGDLFNARQRGRALAVFNAAIPVGMAFGYLLGGWAEAHWGWRSVFYIGALPGLLLALTLLATPEPERGAADRDETAPSPMFQPGDELSSSPAAGFSAADVSVAGASLADSSAAGQPLVPAAALQRARAAVLPARGLARPPAAGAWRTYRALLSNPLFFYATFGMALTTFSLGAYSVWIPSFLIESRHLPTLRANLLFGVFSIFNGIVATLAGGWFADRRLRRHRGALYTVSAWSLILGLPVAALALFAPGPRWFLPAIFFAEFLLLFNGGPMNAAVVNSVPAEVRATAMGLNLVIIHLLGDAVSPPLVGWLADRTHNLPLAMASVLPVMLAAACFFLRGARCLESPPA